VEAVWRVRKGSVEGAKRPGGDWGGVHPTARVRTILHTGVACLRHRLSTLSYTLRIPAVTPLRILADADIPFANAAFGRYGEVRLLPGHAFTPEAAGEADVLLVRSVTRVDVALLANSRVRFVGTATAGLDHVDTAYLAAQGIAFADAPGSNADSVVEYVLAALLAVAANQEVGLRGRTIGIVGCGQVGGRLAARASALGLRVLCCDPPLAEAAEARGEVHAYVSFAAVLAEADVVTLHTPLTRPGTTRHPTAHLMNTETLSAMKPGAWLFNASRGGVVDTNALKASLDRLGPVVLDVWEGEPLVDVPLARSVALATPHIAGYAYDAKVEGTRMLEAAFRRWWAEQGYPPPPPWVPTLGEGMGLEVPPSPKEQTPEAEARWLDTLVRRAYDVRADDARFRATLGGAAENRAAAFRRLRAEYPVRRAFARHVVDGAAVPPSLRAPTFDGLGFSRRP